MLKAFVYSSLIAYLTSIHLVQAANYGVGFSLSLDYGTSSIYFSNGTFVDIAKVEGSPAYKHMMRTINIPDITTDTPLTQPTDSQHQTAPQSLILSKLRSYLPPWLGGGPDPLFEPLSWMLSALKATTESYISTSLHSTEIVFPFPIPSSFLTALRSATSSLSLTMPLSAQAPAGILAARAQGIRGGQCDPWATNQQGDARQLILTIDYSRAALTALLVHEECGIFEVRRVVHDTHLGAAENLPCTADTETEVNANSQRRDGLARAIRDVTHLPLEDGNGAGISRVSEVMLLGERAGDALLHDVLREVLGERYSGRSTQECRIEPVFAASRGLAMDCWDRLDFQDRENGRGASNEL